MTSGKIGPSAPKPRSPKTIVTLVGEDKIPSGVLSRNVRIVPVLLEETVGVSRATRVSTVFWTTRGESWCRRFHTDNKQFQAKQRMLKIVMRSLIPDAEEAVCTASTLRFHLTSVLCLGIQCAICFWFCGAALVRTLCDSEVVCASPCNSVMSNEANPTRRLGRRSQAQ